MLSRVSGSLRTLIQQSCSLGSSLGQCCDLQLPFTALQTSLTLLFSPHQALSLTQKAHALFYTMQGLKERLDICKHVLLLFVHTSIILYQKILFPEQRFGLEVLNSPFGFLLKQWLGSDWSMLGFVASKLQWCSTHLSLCLLICLLQLLIFLLIRMCRSGLHFVNSLHSSK